MTINPIHYRTIPTVPPNSPDIHHPLTHNPSLIYECDADESESDELHEDCTELHEKAEGQGTTKLIQIQQPKLEWANIHFGD